MENFLSRTELIIGKEGVNKLKKSKIAIFGIGGVGSYVVEALARAGICNFVLVDHDIISMSNINRQIIATTSTVGKYKVDVAKDRILEINPSANVECFKEFFLPETKGIIDNTLNYVVDCVDTVTAKIEIIKRSKEYNLPVISSMGTGNKLDPTKFKIADISKTSICPLAKVMRKELKNRNIKNVKVLYSTEEPIKIDKNLENEILKENTNKRQIPGSISFVPSVAGLIIAGEIIKDLIK